MKGVFLQLPWCPSQSSYYDQNRFGRRLSKRGILYREKAIEACVEQNAYGLINKAPLDLAAILYPPDKRTRDLDNHLKGLQDALTHAKVYVDDSAISQLHTYRGVIIPHGMVLVRITQGFDSIPIFSNLFDAFKGLES